MSHDAPQPPLPERPDLMAIISELHTQVAVLKIQIETYQHFVDRLNDALEDHA